MLEKRLRNACKTILSKKRSLRYWSTEFGQTVLENQSPNKSSQEGRNKFFHFETLYLRHKESRKILYRISELPDGKTSDSVDADNAQQVSLLETAVGELEKYANSL